MKKFLLCKELVECGLDRSMWWINEIKSGVEFCGNKRPENSTLSLNGIEQQRYFAVVQPVANLLQHFTILTYNYRVVI